MVVKNLLLIMVSDFIMFDVIENYELIIVDMIFFIEILEFEKKNFVEKMYMLFENMFFLNKYIKVFIIFLIDEDWENIGKFVRFFGKEIKFIDLLKSFIKGDWI